MNTQEIKDVLEVSRILYRYESEDTPADVIAALINWRDDSLGRVEVQPPAEETPAKPKVAPPSKSKRAKATESQDSEDFEPTPDPSTDDEPDF